MSLRVARLALVSSFIFAVAAQIGFDAWANDRYESSYYVIHATPFDEKLASVGFFDRSKMAEVKPKKIQSVENLFQLARSFRYVPHDLNDQWQSAEETASKGSGNCADKAVWLYTQLRRNGYNNTRLVIGKYRSIDPMFHVWITYTDETGSAYILDPTIQRKPWKIMDFYQNFYRPLYSFGGGNRYRMVNS